MPKIRLTRRVATTACTLVWMLAFAFVASAALPYNVLSPGLRAERWLRLVLPEGWGFFTRDAREPDLLIARKHGDRWLLEPPHASASHAFGLLRLSRVLPVEASQLIAAASSSFSPCQLKDLEACIERAPLQRVPSDVQRPFLCGDVALVRRAPVPWAWADLM